MTNKALPGSSLVGHNEPDIRESSSKELLLSRVVYVELGSEHRNIYTGIIEIYIYLPT